MTFPLSKTSVRVEWRALRNVGLDVFWNSAYRTKGDSMHCVDCWKQVHEGFANLGPKKLKYHCIVIHLVHCEVLFSLWSTDRCWLLSVFSWLEYLVLQGTYQVRLSFHNESFVDKKSLLSIYFLQVSCKNAPVLKGSNTGVFRTWSHSHEFS